MKTLPRHQVWFLATRPKTLTASIIPVLVGTAVAFHESGNVHWHFVFLAILSALAIQIGTNLFNDAIDFKKGADTEERLGPVRVTQMGYLSEKQVMGGAIFVYLLSFFCALPLILHGGLVFAFLFSISLLLGYLYTGGPYPLAYYGLGDLFVFLFFGVVATAASGYLQQGIICSNMLFFGTQIGLLSVALIAINNLRDINQDRKAGKNTLAVIFGVFFSRVEITFCLMVPFLMSLFQYFQTGLFLMVLPVLFFPLAFKLSKDIWREEPSRCYNAFLAKAAAIHLLFGVTLTYALFLSPILVKR